LLRSHRRNSSQQEDEQKNSSHVDFVKLLNFGLAIFELPDLTRLTLAPSFRRSCHERGRYYVRKLRLLRLIFRVWCWFSLELAEGTPLLQNRAR
jgi:hypothetical protein